MLTPHNEAGYMSSEWTDLDRKIREGDGIMWPGDPRMWLGVGIVEARGHQGRITRKAPVGRRLEVWRDCEDGESRLVGAWHPTELFRILVDLCAMRVEAPGHVSAETRIDDHNDKIEKDAADAQADKTCEALEHALRLRHDKLEPQTRFYGVKEATTIGDRDFGSSTAESPPDASKSAESTV